MDEEQAAAAVRVLVVEDNRVDANLVRMAMQEVRDWPTEVAVVDDGEKAIHYLLRIGAYAAAARPELVILDLNLPKYDGTEVLQTIRGHPELLGMVVVVVSSSPLDVIEDKVRNAQVEADGYFTKPFHLEEFLALGKEIFRCFREAGRRSGQAAAR